MLNSLLQRYLFLSLQTRRLTHFLFLLLSLTISQALFALLARSLFLDRVGPQSLPLLFTITPLVLIAVSTGFIGVVNRISHIRLFRWILFGSIFLVGGMQVLIAQQTNLFPFFGLYILSNLLSVLLIKISFSTLFADYFTALELKRYTAFLSLSANIGFLLANSLGSIIVQFIPPENLLLVIPSFYAIAIAQLIYLEFDQKSIEINPPELKNSSQGFLESLIKFPRLIKHYPIIFYLTASTFIILLLRLLTEFLFSTVYTQQFPQKQDLTSFLGISSAIFSLVQLLLTSLVTTPLFQKLGISRANLIYPVTTLISFIGFIINFGFPTALFSNLNHVAIYRSIADPLKSVNYNAIPPQARGTFRILSEGLFSPLGEMAGGLILLALMMSSDSSLIVSVLGIGLSLILLGFSLKTGKNYVKSLMKMLISGSVNLDNVRPGFSLPSTYQTEVQNLLNSDDPNHQILGLQLAVYLQSSQQFLPEINALLTQADRSLKPALVSFLKHLPPSILSEWLQQALNSNSLTTQAVALELIIAKNQLISATQLEILLADEQEEIRALTCVAVTAHQQSLHPQIKKVCQQLWQMKLDCPIAQATIDAISHTGRRELIPILYQILPQTSCEIKQQGFKALVSLASSQDLHLKELAASELGNPNPEVRAAALELLGVVHSLEMLPYLATSLQDIDCRVRVQAAQAIASYGERSLDYLEDSLTSTRREVIEAAITAIGYIGTHRAEDLLYEHLSLELQQVSRTIKWKLPHESPRWKLLEIAVHDFHFQMIERVFYVLSALGCHHTLEAMRVLRYSPDQKSRANAVETIASLRYRRFILPILPLLEKWAEGQAVTQEVTVNAEWMKTTGYKILLEALDCKNRWIEIGAIVALASVPSVLIQTPDTLVQEVVEQVFPSTVPLSNQNLYFMNRILLLKNISLFKQMSLDELLILNKELIEEEYMEGEVIIREGSIGTHLYLVCGGTVALTQSVERTQHIIKSLSSGEYFGEYQLFAESPSSVGVIAVTDCQLLKLEKNRLLSLTYQRPDLLIEICKQLSHIIEGLLIDGKIRPYS